MMIPPRWGLKIIFKPFRRALPCANDFKAFSLFIKFLFLSTALFCLQGCITGWAIKYYGKTEEKFISRNGPAHGDANRLYVQGEMEVNPHLLFQSAKRFPAYVVINLKDWKIISKEIFEGQLPACAQDYPPIMPGNIKDVDSGLEMIFDRSVIWVNKNPRNKLDVIGLDDKKEHPRTTAGKIACPFVCVGAVAADIVLIPAYFVFGVFFIFNGAG